MLPLFPSRPAAISLDFGHIRFAHGLATRRHEGWQRSLVGYHQHDMQGSFYPFREHSEYVVAKLSQVAVSRVTKKQNETAVHL